MMRLSKDHLQMQCSCYHYNQLGQLVTAAKIKQQA